MGQPMLTMSSDNYSTLAIGTVQSNIFDFNLVTDGVRHEDEERSASKDDTQATNKDNTISGTMEPLCI